jgi:hypothetical protein
MYGGIRPAVGMARSRMLAAYTSTACGKPPRSQAYDSLEPSAPA